MEGFVRVVFIFLYYLGVVLGSLIVVIYFEGGVNVWFWLVYGRDVGWVFFFVLGKIFFLKCS